MSISKIALHFGLNDRLDKTVEELAELIQAIMKFKEIQKISFDENVTTSICALESIFDELADVEVMTEQLKYLLSKELTINVDLMVKIRKNDKISRTIQRYDIN